MPTQLGSFATVLANGLILVAPPRFSEKRKLVLGNVAARVLFTHACQLVA
jgi:hypothetical protein